MSATESSTEETLTATALLARIRAVAEARVRAGAPEPPPQALFPSEVEPWEPFPWRRAAGALPPLPAAFVSVLDVADLEPSRFVRYCHQALLGRSPTRDETARWEGRIGRGWPRVAVVLAIRGSREGIARGVRLEGVRARLTLDVRHLVRSRLRIGSRR